jgi:hypothetical protein
VLTLRAKLFDLVLPGLWGGHGHGAEIHWRGTHAVQLLRFVITTQPAADRGRAPRTPSRTCASSPATASLAQSIACCRPNTGFALLHAEHRISHSHPNRQARYRACRYQSRIQSPQPASAANTSGFLQVSLSKTPRSGVHVFARPLCAEAFPMKASDLKEVADAADPMDARYEFGTSGGLGRDACDG